MAISQSVLDNAAAAMISSMLPKAPMEVAIGQSVALQSKTSGIAMAGEKGVDLVNAAIQVEQATTAGNISAELKAAAETMLKELMAATGAVGKQASEVKLPK